MEKSIFRLLVFLCVLIFQYSYSQDSLCVYNVAGTIYLQTPSNSKTLFKGEFLTKTSALKILPDSKLIAIDNNGNSYINSTEGILSFNNLLLSKEKKGNTSLTTKYFKYVWDELLNKNNNQTLIAGVFRGDLLMKTPKDSSLIASDKLSFKWDKTDADLYYLFIQNIQTGELLKIETDGSQISLYNENSIFLGGDTFKWTISTDAFPNLKNMPFYSFILIDSMQYSDLLTEYNELIYDLKQIGINASDIDTILCETYGLCK